MHKKIKTLYEGEKKIQISLRIEVNTNYSLFRSKLHSA